MIDNGRISIPVEDIPAEAESINCDKHGEYEARYMKMTGGKAFVSRHCPECAKESKQEEKEKEEQKRMEWVRERKIKGLLSAGVSKRNLGKVFSSFRIDSDGQQKALTASKQFVSDVCSSNPANNMFFIGSVGTGKTHLASSIIQELHDTKSVRMIRVIELIRILKETWQRGSENTERDVIEHFGGIDVLILDEVGIQFGSETERMFMFDIINTRYDNMLPTILISNLDINNLKEILGEQAVDRLREDGGKVLVFNWESQRK